MNKRIFTEQGPDDTRQFDRLKFDLAAKLDDPDALGIERPTHEPRATEFIPQMLSMISTLERKGLAYRSPNGDVNYAVRKFPGYGKLSGKTLDELHAGERERRQGGGDSAQVAGRVVEVRRAGQHAGQVVGHHRARGVVGLARVADRHRVPHDIARRLRRRGGGLADGEGRDEHRHR